MTREEIYQLIYTHDTIYVPPHEEGSAPLEVQLGCSWGKCTFCDFTKDKFRIHPLERIEQNIQILGLLQPDNPRLFLLGENAFCMNTDYLLKILALKDKYMPKVTSFAMYSRIDDISRKTDEDLLLLKSKGLSALHIGIESGCDQILKLRRKGVTSEDMIRELHRLDAAGIMYFVTIIPGLGGKSLSEKNALETAKLLNQVRPQNIWCLKLKLWEGTTLYKEWENGEFDMMTPEEIILEERLLIENLTVEKCLFEDTTVLDNYTIKGILPEQKEALLQAIDYLVAVRP